MTQTILIILAVAVVVILLTGKGRQVVKSGAQKVTGICAVVLGQTAQKQENKEKILTLLAKNDKLSNSDICQALGVSDRSVIRYMDELERQGKVEQLGDTGRGVSYCLKQ